MGLRATQCILNGINRIIMDKLAPRSLMFQTDGQTDGRMDGRTDNVKTVYHTTNRVCGGYNQIQCSVRFIKRTIYGTLAHRLKRQEEWVDRWSMERIKRTHPSPRPPPVTSNSQCCTSIIIKHKEIATFPSSILHQGVPQAQVTSNTMMAGSKNAQDKDMSCKHKNHAGLKHARLTHAFHDSPSKHPLSPKMS